MKLAVFGKTGQVATELGRRSYPGVSMMSLDRSVADFTDPDAVASAAARVSADAILNAVAYTAVDKAESEEDSARLVNAESVSALAEVAKDRGIPLIHVSTDYVFDGSGDAPRATDAVPNPLGVYGWTKLAGENAVTQAGGSFAILRTSWVFSAHGGNFVKTMLRLAEDRDSLGIVADQIGGPTPAAAIADAMVSLARSLTTGGPSGIYHFAGAPDVSWADFAREIFSQAGKQVTVSDITTQDYPTPAKRPLNSRLDCESLARDHGIMRPDWRAGLEDVLEELGKT